MRISLAARVFIIEKGNTNMEQRKKGRSPINVRLEFKGISMNSRLKKQTNKNTVFELCLMKQTGRNFSNKRNPGFLERWLITGLGQKKYRMN